jgi:N-acyl-D-amino-acid deacylase
MLDLLVTNAAVVDGTGSPRIEAHVGVQGDLIAFVRPVDGSASGGAPAGEARSDTDVPPARRVVAAEGRVLAPGFIDVHTHSDLAPFTDVWMDSALRQGVTTVVVGNCGGGAWPRKALPDLVRMLGITADALGGGWDSAAAYLDAVDAAAPACNVATLAGFGSLRTSVMGHERRPASHREIGAMRALLAEALQGGALGMSTGLIYVPDMYAATEEVAAVAAAMRPYGGLYTTHMRAEGRLLFEGVREALAIGERAGVHPHISHLKLEGGFAWGRVDELLELVLGGDASTDQYPYTAWETDLASFLPPWAPVEDLPALVADPVAKRRLVDSMEHGEVGWESSIDGAGWELIVLEDAEGLEGRTIAEAAAEREQPPVEFTLDLLQKEPDAAVSGHTMNEDDVRAILSHGDVMVGSDGMAVAPDGPLARSLLHPRSYGTFPRVLGRYARDEGLLTLETAVHKMTGLSAAVFGLDGRGVVAEGAIADLVLFDPSTIVDMATFTAPHSYPDGIDLVVVNGRVAWDGARGERAGRAVRRSSH